MLKAHAIKILDFYILKLKRSHCARTDYILCKASKLQRILKYKYQTKFELV
jgi:hypothetical protein